MGKNVGKKECNKTKKRKKDITKIESLNEEGCPSHHDDHNKNNNKVLRLPDVGGSQIRDFS
jgi:hypothetical protein